MRRATARPERLFTYDFGGVGVVVLAPEADLAVAKPEDADVLVAIRFAVAGHHRVALVLRDEHVGIDRLVERARLVAKRREHRERLTLHPVPHCAPVEVIG